MCATYLNKIKNKLHHRRTLLSASHLKVSLYSTRRPWRMLGNLRVEAIVPEGGACGRYKSCRKVSYPPVRNKSFTRGSYTIRQYAELLHYSSVRRAPTLFDSTQSSYTSTVRRGRAPTLFDCTQSSTIWQYTELLHYSTVRRTTLFDSTQSSTILQYAELLQVRRAPTLLDLTQSSSTLPQYAELFHITHSFSTSTVLRALPQYAELFHSTQSSSTIRQYGELFHSSIVRIALPLVDSTQSSSTIWQYAELFLYSTVRRALQLVDNTQSSSTIRQ